MSGSGSSGGGMLRRFYSNFKGVTTTRNNELITYQQQLKRMRKGYQEEFSHLPTKSQQEQSFRLQGQKLRKEKWDSYLERLRSDLINPRAEINRDRHLCRPIIEHTKTPEQRTQAIKNMSNSLAKYQITRRKYLKVFDTQLDKIVTLDNLEARIQSAIANPTSFNVSPNEMVKKELDIRNRIITTKVPKDPVLFQCGEKYLKEKPSKGNQQ